MESNFRQAESGERVTNRFQIDTRDRNTWLAICGVLLLWMIAWWLTPWQYAGWWGVAGCGSAWREKHIIPKGCDAPVAQSASIVPTPVALPNSDFDFKKKERQIDWCLGRLGVPAMTFTRDGSNVLCLKQASTITIPKDAAP